MRENVFENLFFSFEGEEEKEEEGGYPSSL